MKSKAALPILLGLLLCASFADCCCQYGPYAVLLGASGSTSSYSGMAEIYDYTSTDGSKEYMVAKTISGQSTTFSIVLVHTNGTVKKTQDVTFTGLSTIGIKPTVVSIAYESPSRYYLGGFYFLNVNGHDTAIGFAAAFDNYALTWSSSIANINNLTDVVVSQMVQPLGQDIVVGGFSAGPIHGASDPYITAPNSFMVRISKTNGTQLWIAQRNSNSANHLNTITCSSLMNACYALINDVTGFKVWAVQYANGLNSIFVTPSLSSYSVVGDGVIHHVDTVTGSLSVGLYVAFIDQTLTGGMYQNSVKLLLLSGSNGTVLTVFPPAPFASTSTIPDSTGYRVLGFDYDSIGNIYLSGYAEFVNGQLESASSPQLIKYSTSTPALVYHVSPSGQGTQNPNRFISVLAEDFVVIAGETQSTIFSSSLVGLQDVFVDTYLPTTNPLFQGPFCYSPSTPTTPPLYNATGAPTPDNNANVNGSGLSLPEWLIIFIAVVIVVSLAIIVLIIALLLRKRKKKTKNHMTTLSSLSISTTTTITPTSQPENSSISPDVEMGVIPNNYELKTQTDVGELPKYSTLNPNDDQAVTSYAEKSKIDDAKTAIDDSTSSTSMRSSHKKKKKEKQTNNDVSSSTSFENETEQPQENGASSSRSQNNTHSMKGKKKKTKSKLSEQQSNSSALEMPQEADTGEVL